MKKIVKSLRKILVSLLGFPLFILGIILIPLPGPGLLVSLLALLILSLEFDWADRNFQKGKEQLKRIIEKSKSKSQE